MANLFIKIIIFISILQLNNCNVCDLCHCAQKKQNENNNQTNLKIIIVECKNTIKNNLKLELDNIQWPTNIHLIDAYFNDLKLSYLPKLVWYIFIVYYNANVKNNNIIKSCECGKYIVV